MIEEKLFRFHAYEYTKPVEDKILQFQHEVQLSDRLTPAPPLCLPLAIFEAGQVFSKPPISGAEASIASHMTLQQEKKGFRLVYI